GVVWAENPNPNPRLRNRLKDIDAKLDVPPLKVELRSFVDWVSNYTLPARERVGVRMTDAKPQRMTPARQRVMAALADGFVRSKSEAAEAAGVSAGVVNGLVDEGVIETVLLPPEPLMRAPDPDFRKPDFSL